MLRFAISAAMLMAAGHAQAVELPATVVMANGDGLAMTITEFLACVRKSAPQGADLGLQVDGDAVVITGFYEDVALEFEFKRRDEFTSDLVRITTGPEDDEEGQVSVDIDEYIGDLVPSCD